MKSALSRSRRQEIMSAAIAQTLWLMAGCSLLFMVMAQASDPGWWTSLGAVDGGLGTNDYQVVNEGQLKQFTSRAVTEMNDTMAGEGGSGTALSNLVYGWSNNYYTNGYNATNLKPSDYTVMNVGQIKYIGNLVWSQLIADGYTEYPPTWLDSNAADTQWANAGQLKTVFDFDPTVAPAAVTGLTATPVTDGIDLTWTNPANNPVTGIEIQEDIGGTWTTIANLDASADSYDVSGLTPGDSIELQAVAKNDFTSSTPTTITTPDAAPAPPTGLTGTLDTTNGYMNLSWIASTGAIDYEIDRETITSGTWAYLDDTFSAATNYIDTGYGSGGYRYRVSASADESSYSAYSSVFPLPQYVIIDLGETEIPVAFNNAGAAVLSSTDTTNIYYWSAGSTTLIPLGGVYGMNGNGTVVGFAANSVPTLGNTNSPAYTVDFIPIATWTTGGGLGTPQTTPTTDYITNAAPYNDLSTWEGTNGAPYNGTIVFGPVGIGTNGYIYGGGGEVLYGAGDEIPSQKSAHFGERIDTSSRIGDTIITYDYPSPEGYSVQSGGTYYNFTAENDQGMALGCEQTVTTGASGASPPFGTVPTPTWFAYDGTEFDLAGVPVAIAANNNVSGYTNSLAGPCLWTNLTTAPIFMTNGITGPINSQDQVVSGSSFWESNVLYNLSDLVYDANGWSNITAAGFNGAINDNGAIAGTAETNGVTHGVILIPDFITRDGGPITNAVWVGQQINLTNMVLGSATNATVTSYQWGIPGAAFKSYAPLTNSPYTCNYTTNNLSDYTNNFMSYYWSDGATNRIVTCTNVIDGQTCVATATLDVNRPGAGIIAKNEGPIAVDNNFFENAYSTYFHDGGQTNPPPTRPGMLFYETNSLSPANTGTFGWVQMITSDSIDLVVTESGTSLPAGVTNSGLDTTFPYGSGPATNANDSPNEGLVPVGSGETEQNTRSFVATMYLIWQPTTNMVGSDNVAWVPLRGINWNWYGYATNNGSGWGLANSTNSSVSLTNDYDPLTQSTFTNEVRWTNNASP